jgi:oligopeptide transport system permease protein
MFGYVTRRVLSAIPVALIAITACFFILRLAPGGPFDGERALPPVTLANQRAHYNLDLPLIQQ